MQIAIAGHGLRFYNYIDLYTGMGTGKEKKAVPGKG